MCSTMLIIYELVTNANIKKEKKKQCKIILGEKEAIKNYNLHINSRPSTCHVPKRFLLVTATTGDHPGDDLKR